MSKKQEETATALAEAPKNGLTATNASGIDISPSDIDVPRVNVVQKTSEIEAPLGAVVLDKQHVLSLADETIPVTVLSVLKGWRENIDYDSDEIPRVAHTQEEADQIKANSEYDMLEFAEITILFKKPEGSDNDAAAFNPKASLQHRLWDFKSSMISRGKYSWFAPSLGIRKDEPTDEVKAFVGTFS